MNMGVYHSFEKKEKATMFFLKKPLVSNIKQLPQNFFHWDTRFACFYSCNSLIYKINTDQ